MAKKGHVGVLCMLCKAEYGKTTDPCPKSDDGEHAWEDPFPWETGPGGFPVGDEAVVQEAQVEEDDKTVEEPTPLDNPTEPAGDPEADEEEEEEPDLDLVQALSDEIQRDRATWTRGKGRIFASELGLALGPDHDGCVLSWWAQVHEGAEQKEKTPGEQLMLLAGDLMHDYIANLMKTACLRNGWEVVAIEKRVYLEHDGETIGSRLDVKIRHIETGWTRVVDIKTKRGAAFKFLEEAKAGNVLQVQGYIKAEEANDGSLLYVDREGQNFMKEFLVERDDSRPEKAIEILKGIRDSDTPPAPIGLKVRRVTNKGPDSIYVNVPWQIQWCNLKECRCKKALGGKTPPDKIVAKLHGKSPDFEVRPAGGYEQWAEYATPILQEMFPNERFTYAAATEEQPKKKTTKKREKKS